MHRGGAEGTDIWKVQRRVRAFRLENEGNKEGPAIGTNLAGLGRSLAFLGYDLAHRAGRSI